MSARVRLAALLAAALGAASGCLTLDSLLYNPVPVDGYHWDEADPNLDGELTDPHPSVVPAADRQEGFVAADGDQIHWVFAHRAGARGTILYSHGNNRNLGRYWDRVERLWEHGFQVLVYDYPGFGRSTGSPDEASVFAAAEAVIELLSTLPDVDPARVWFLGYSLGAAPSFAMAVRGARGELPVAPVGVISEAAFCSTEALVQDGSFLDLDGDYLVENALDNCARMAELERPTLVIHGAADSFIVVRHAETLHGLAIAPSTLWVVPGGHHSDLPLVAGDEYDARVIDFVQTTAAAP